MVLRSRDIDSFYKILGSKNQIKIYLFNENSSKRLLHLNSEKVNELLYNFYVWQH